MHLPGMGEEALGSIPSTAPTPEKNPEKISSCQELEGGMGGGGEDDR